MPDGSIVPQDTAEAFFARLPPEIAAGFSAVQREAIAAALAARDGAPPPVNLRLSFPFFLWRCYFALLAGRERRGAARRKAERVRHPIRTAGNFLFVLAGAMAFYLLALTGFLVYASVLDF